MRSFPAAFVTEKNKKTGATPIWILKLTVDSVDYYLSDQVVTLTGWSGSPSTLPWVASWGSVSQQLTGMSTEIMVGDLSISCVVDNNVSPTIADLSYSSTFEKSPAVLYLWFLGLDAATAPPQEVFSGYIRDVAIPDDITVELSIEDATVRLHNMVGTLVTTAAWPNVDPDHVGKILPLPYGTVKNVPAIATVAGLMTTLKADITAVATSCQVARPEGIVAGTTRFKLGTEVVLVTAVSGDTLTITRAQNGTTAAVHSAGDRMLEYVVNPFAFVVSGHAVTAINKVVVRAGEVDIDITDQCTRYTGQVGSQYSTYGSRAVVTISQAQATVIQGRVLKAAELAISDPSHTHTPSLVTTAIHPTGYTVMAGNAVANCARAYDKDISTYCTIGAYGGTGSLIRYYCAYALGLTGKPKRIRICGINENNTGFYDLQLTLYFMGTSRLSLICYHNGTQYTSGWYDIPDANESWTNLLYSANTYITAATYNPVTAESHLVELWMEVEWDQATVSGTTGITGTINSVADAILGGQVHADVTAPLTAPDAVINDLLTTWGGVGGVTLSGAYPGGYAFGGVVLEQERLLDLVQRLAWQCRSWFRVMGGSARLIVRPSTLTSQKTIPACRIKQTGRVYSRRKTELDEVVNVINLRYGRDWTMADGDDAYLAVSTASNATSIADYGTREKPELFRMDFIATAAMADSVRDFYLADLMRRKWLHDCEVYLDHVELESGDIVTLGFSDNAVVELLQAGVSPGDKETMDTVRLVGRG